MKQDNSEQTPQSKNKTRRAPSGRDEFEWLRPTPGEEQCCSPHITGRNVMTGQAATWAGGALALAFVIA